MNNYDNIKNWNARKCAKYFGDCIHYDKLIYAEPYRRALIYGDHHEYGLETEKDAILYFLSNVRYVTKRDDPLVPVIKQRLREIAKQS